MTCGIPLDDGGAHCFDCRGAGRFAFAANRSAVRFEGIARTLVHLFKYRQRDYLAQLAGSMMAACVQRAYSRERIDLVIPVPMHPLKRWLRGYNQSEILAVRVAAAIGRPCSPAALSRSWGKALAGRSRDERARSVRGAFFPRSGLSVRGIHVLLIDDVATTCATLDACARALRDAGAARVLCATFARD